jgi:hypothetical protein
MAGRAIIPAFSPRSKASTARAAPRRWSRTFVDRRHPRRRWPLRSVSEIADRFLEQSSARAGAPVAHEKRVVLERFLDIAGDPDAASASLRALADDCGLD